MTPIDGELVRPQWGHSAAESQVLLTGSDTDPTWVLRLALLELVARRALKLVSAPDRRLLVKSKRTDVFVMNASRQILFDPPLQSVLDLWPRTRRYLDGTVGVAVDRLARAVFMNYRSQGGYVNAVVLPSLRLRKLYTQESYARFAIFTRSRWVLTDAGMSALVDLKELMEEGRDSFNPWSKPDRARADAYLEAAGASVLLLNQLPIAIDHVRSSAGNFRRPEAPNSGPFNASALAGYFGPEEFDGLEMANSAISVGVQRAWASIQRSGGE